ncbi:hypothetical protein [Sulfitobacter pontiacus]|uniref:hypothetical protein n=1 Tax=Sulfitobacter pontiacus TaxID=60137 RepID=UPI0030EDDDD3
MTAGKIRWLRFLPRTALKYSPKPLGVSIFVPMQPWHFAELGCTNQSDLTGPGEADVKFVTFFPPNGVWTPEQGYEYCKTALTELLRDERENPNRAIQSVACFGAEATAGKRYCRQQVLHNGLISQETLIPSEIVNKMLAASKSDANEFHLLRFIGLYILDTQTFDMQPPPFRDWFTGVISGQIKAPGPTPKNFALIRRHNLIRSLVRTLEHHKIKPTTSIVEMQGVSGCGLVARGICEAKINQPRSYDGVRKIWEKRNKHQ